MSLVTSLVEWLSSVPPQIAVMIIAALPVAELRAAIPVAVGVYHMSALSALFWSVVGNMIPIYFILILFERVSAWLRVRSKKVDQLLTWLFERTQRKLEKDVVKYGWWALAIFVAIPLPATGAWTGALAAFVFGLPKKKAFFSIFAGVIGAGIIVTILTVGVGATIKAFN